MCQTGYLFLSVNVSFVPQSCFIPYPLHGVPARPRRGGVAWGQGRSPAAPCWALEGDGLPGPGRCELALAGEEGAGPRPARCAPATRPPRQEAAPGWGAWASQDSGEGSDLALAACGVGVPRLRRGVSVREGGDE